MRLRVIFGDASLTEGHPSVRRLLVHTHTAYTRPSIAAAAVNLSGFPSIVLLQFQTRVRIAFRFAQKVVAQPQACGLRSFFLFIFVAASTRALNLTCTRCRRTAHCI